MKKKIAFKTLGCRLNQYETDALRSRFIKNGYEVVNYNEKADIYIINTCTVTHQSDSKSRNIIRQAHKNNNESLIIVTGCMVDNYQAELKEILPEVNYFVDNDDKSGIFDRVEAHFSDMPYIPTKESLSLFDYEAAKETSHTRSMIKVQDGCDNYCTYCIIPHVRGIGISRPLPDILDNIRKVLDFGYKEIVLTGVNIGRYEWQGIDFDEMLKQILDLSGDFRVRISSIEPEGFTSKLYQLFNHPKLTPHLHLCLQSGSNDILSSMKRSYRYEDFERIITSIRKINPNFNFTTDLIVGFPGETEEDFNQSLQAIQQLQFSHVHTFKYSKREGTIAVNFDNQISEKIKSERSKKMREVAEKVSETYLSSFTGKEQTVLIEKVDKQGNAYGYGEYFIRIKISPSNHVKNTFVKVTIKDLIQIKNEWVLLADAYS